MKQAAIAGLDPAIAWDNTVDELMDTIDAFKSRMELISMFGFNLAQGIAAMCLSERKPRPEQVFPGWITRKEQTPDEMYNAMLACCAAYSPN